MGRAPISSCVLCLALCAGAAAQDGKKAGDQASGVVGEWASLDRHVAMGSLFQPEHGVRKREGEVHFKEDGGRLTGYSFTEDYKDVTNQKGGRTAATSSPK